MAVFQVAFPDGPHWRTLGLGIEPGTPSWGIDMSGTNLSTARLGYWHIVVFPGLAISLVVLAANLLGDALRDIWDPRLRK